MRTTKQIIPGLDPCEQAQIDALNWMLDKVQAHFVPKPEQCSGTGADNGAAKPIREEGPDFRYPGEEDELAELGKTRAPGCNHVSHPDEIDEKTGLCCNCTEEDSQ